MKRFCLDFGVSWASKSAALLAAPGVLNPTAFITCIKILLLLSRGGGEASIHGGQNLAMLGLCRHFFRSWAPFFASWAFLGTLWANLAHLHRFGGVLDRLRLEFGRFWGRPGEVLEAWEVYFRRVFVLVRLVCVKASTFTKHWQEQ